MGFLGRTLKFLAALVLTAAVVLWFAARRGDRGYIEEEITIDRSAPVVFRWLTTEELMRRWISDVIKLERTGPGGPTGQMSGDYRLEEYVANRPVAFDVRVMRTIANQGLDLLLKPPDGSTSSYISDAKFKLLPDGDYTRVVFTSQTKFYSLNEQIFEPILTYATRRKLRDDLGRLKLMIEAEAATPQENRGRVKGQK